MTAGGEAYIFVSHASADNARLRPVLVALLDEGVPLWFDKPDSVGLAGDLFAGSLTFGQSWSNGVLSALERAAGVVVFPSEAAARSQEVFRECGFAQAQRRSLGDRFALLSCLIGPDSDLSETSITQGLHALPTYVERSVDGDWRLTPDGQTGVAMLSRMLSSHLKRLHAEQTAPTRSAAPPGAEQQDYAVPYLVDRVTQREAAVNAFDARDRPPVLIVHGPEAESPSRFAAVNLPWQVIAAHPLFPRGQAAAPPLRPRWPGADPTSGPAFALGLVRNILERLQSAPEIDSPEVWSSVAELKTRLSEAVAREGVVRLVVARFEPSDASARAVREAILAWTDFWDDFPFARLKPGAGFLLLPVLEVVHARTDAGRAWTFWRKPDAARGVLDSAAFDADLKRRSRRTTPHLLPGLSPVTPRCVRDWIYADPLFDACSEDRREALTEDLLKLFSTAGAAGQPQLPMRDWAQLSKPVLRAADIE